jgi:hypothetical protein
MSRAGRVVPERVVAAVVALALLLPAIGFADAREAYKTGVEAVEAGRFAEAEQAFREAIAERGEEKVPLIGRRYLPHFYLGVALAEQGRCRGALESFTVSERQGKIARAEDEAAELERRKAECRARLDQLAASRRRVEELLAEGRDTAATLAALAERPLLAARWSEGESSFAARRKSALERLEQAESRVETGFAGEDPEALAEAERLATGALTELRQTIAAARRELGELNAAAAEALERLEEDEREAQRLVRSVADLQPYPPQLSRRVAEVATLLERVAASKEETSAARIDELRDELRSAAARLRDAAAGPPRRLRQAVEAYLAGEFPRTLELLADTEFSDPRAALHASLLRAAAYHALFLLGGEREPELLDLAREEAAAGHRLDPDFEPAGRYFSPRFLDFYRAVQPEEAAEDDRVGSTDGEETQTPEPEPEP